MAKRGYKLQEFVAHSSNVNCLRIGKKACRLLLTGGDDYKVNLWAIGKPNSLMGLCGHTSPVESVAFDASEILVLGGASSGVIKLWDLEEAKMVRGVTGHRSNCTAVEFHPFGEFFASGSTDTNLKIWDIRKKGCIHTYKGHTRGIGTIKFTPDGRWVVSGGHDDVVKMWDLTAGKLLHDFKLHENHIRSIDFHPLEFLMATGYADRTVKYWDLETFELIGSSRPEGSGVRVITFHPDGRTLFCGMEDSLKVYSWDPVIRHDTVAMGWSSLGDLCIHEGKIVGCSYYQNSVGVWAADTSLIEPFAKGRTDHQVDHPFSYSPAKVESGVRSLSDVRCTSPDYETKDIKNIFVDTSGGKPVSFQRASSLNSSKVLLSPDLKDRRTLTAQSPRQSSVMTSPEKLNGRNKSLVVPVIINPDSSDGRDAPHSRKDSVTFSRTKPGMLLMPAHSRRPSGTKYGVDNLSMPAESSDIIRSNMVNHHLEQNSVRRDTSKDAVKESSEGNFHNIRSLSRTTSPAEIPKPEKDSKSDSMVNPLPVVRVAFEEKLPSLEDISQKMTSVEFSKVEKGEESVAQSRESNSIKVVRGVAVMTGRTRTLVEKFEKRERLCIVEEQGVITSSPVTTTTGPASRVDAVERKENSISNESRKVGIPSSTSITLDRTPVIAAPVAESLKRRDRLTAYPAADSSPVMATTLDRTAGIVAPLAESLKRRDGFIALPAADDSTSSRFDATERKENSSCSQSHGVSLSSPTSTTSDRMPVAPAPLVKNFKRRDQSVQQIVVVPDASHVMDRTPVIAAPLAASFKRSINVQPIIAAPDVPRVTPMANEKPVPEVKIMEEREPERTGYQQNNMPQDAAVKSMENNKPQVSGRMECNSESSTDVIEVLMESHKVFLSTLRSRLTKLQVARHFWEWKDVKGAINALKRLLDHSVQADVISVLTDKMEILNLDLFSCLLPVLVGLLDSKIERHAILSMEMLMKLVAVFGPLVRSTISACPSVGVDLHAEERLESCFQCWAQMQKIQKILPLLVRRGGLLAKSAQELNLVLQQS